MTAIPSHGALKQTCHSTHPQWITEIMVLIVECLCMCKRMSFVRHDKSNTSQFCFDADTQCSVNNRSFLSTTQEQRTPRQHHHKPQLESMVSLLQPLNWVPCPYFCDATLITIQGLFPCQPSDTSSFSQNSFYTKEIHLIVISCDTQRMK